MAKLKLTVACGDYEITRALSDGSVTADGIDLVMLTDMGSRERHWRTARKNEFDVCETNIGSYYMERDRGEPLTAIPVFLHRRFRHGFIFVNVNSGIRTPKDLIGKRIGGTNFQPASNIWMRGILEEHYGVPHRQCTWVVEREEDVVFTAPKDLRIEMIAPGKRLDVMLAEGEIPAMLSTFLRCSAKATSASYVCSPTTRTSRSNSSRRPQSFRSCTSPSSARRSPRNIHGCRSIW
jgi:4,5-dihydroxyphthalate decarboxylase